MQFCKISPEISFSTTAWYPSKDYRASDYYEDTYPVELFLTVPSEHVAATSGVLQDIIDNGDGTKTHYFLLSLGQLGAAFTSAPRSTVAWVRLKPKK